ncbi:NAD(P)-binding protein [Hymenopellis radicata]|nr:NAD(P)-binding protein [Hymenopellis radicata]
MTTTTKIFLTGVTGYIGGTFLSQLLLHPSVKTFGITVLVRSAEKAQLLKALNVIPVIGSVSDTKLLTEQVAEADVVFNFVNCDDLDAARAILDGMKMYYQRTGVPASLIHTSGTGTLSEYAKGMHGSEEVYSDLDIPHIESLPPTAPHRHVDLAIVDADKQGYAKTYIVIPCTVYGEPAGVLVDNGIQNVYSVQVPSLIKASIARKQAGVVGLGKNVWNNVHVQDLAILYVVLLDHVLGLASHNEFQHGRSGYYFAENGEHELLDVSKGLGVVLNDLGIGSAEPQTFTPEEATHPLFGSRDYNLEILGTNTRCRADRSKAIGWKPSRGTDALLASVRREVQALLPA